MSQKILLKIILFVAVLFIGVLLLQLNRLAGNNQFIRFFVLVVGTMLLHYIYHDGKWS